LPGPKGAFDSDSDSEASKKSKAKFAKISNAEDNLPPEEMVVIGTNG